MASWDRFSTIQFNEAVPKQCVAAASLYSSARPTSHRGGARPGSTLRSSKRDRGVLPVNSKQPSPIELPAPTFKDATSSWSPPSSPSAKSGGSTFSGSPPRSPRVDSAGVLDSPSMAPLTPKERNKLADQLFAAACAGDLEHVKRLLIMGAPINAGSLVESLYESFKPAKSGRLSPLAGAARNSQMDAVELLLAAGAEINPDVSQSSSSPLHEAVRANDVELARLLLELGADVDSLNGYKTTPLMYAVKYGSTSMVKLILELQPDMARLSFIGAAAVHWAVWPNRPEILDLLLVAGADCNHPMGNGSTPLHCAVTGGHLKTVQCLLRRGADPLRKDDDWKTPIQVAEETGHEQITRSLLDAASRRRTV
ncbi:hypothetical protein B0A50_08041 [Salinomyces thailandicus]|uniref:Uncharacterized protein n=1 Tax=Salinomyces thailandicus TaxID=706561 RepID=A0A4U0TKS5_9PEZI|nr:hypothetical protein B0A50_08041 [Salinomyces thailandica]